MAAWLQTNDSLSKTLMTIGIAVILTRLISSCQSAPVVGSAIGNVDPWWHNSCSTIPKTRHQRAARHKMSPLQRLRLQMHNVNTNFQKKIKNQFAQAYNMSFENMRLNTSTHFQNILPKGPIKKNNMKLPVLLAQFHVDTQKYAMELEKLINLEIESDISSSTIRHEVLNVTRDFLKTLLCEVETVINDTRKPNQKDMTFLDVGNEKVLTLDVTETLLLDLRFVQTYEKFLNSWMHTIDKKANGKRKNEKRNANKMKKEAGAKKTRGSVKNASSTTSSPPSAANGKAAKKPQHPSRSVRKPVKRAQGKKPITKS